ncbi:hypothetical protein B0H14DRAFT_2238437, partial [Mycena olivaceomarginata]
LGKWKHAGESNMDEDVLEGFRQVPYTDEVETALRPHLAQLQKLHNNPTGDHPGIPAVAVALENLRRAGGIPAVGDLLPIDCVRVANWFYNNVSGAADSHAYTILIAHRNRDSIASAIKQEAGYAHMDRQSAILVIAWSYQVSRHRFMYTDVDKECLSTFEERLFEYSKRTGVAGYHQWGLDAGPHQDGWNPYHNLPYEWNHED